MTPHRHAPPTVQRMLGARRDAIHEFAAALERADASARVLGARARAARDGAGPAAAFSALAAAGPEGLVPKMGTGGALALRHLEQAAMAAAAADGVLPGDVTDALAHAVAAARDQAGGANALDPRSASSVVRREIAAVRGLADDSLPRDAAWHVMRVGTYLPRAAWISALLLACATAAREQPGAADAVWHAAGLVAGGGELDVLVRDAHLPMSVSRSMDEVVASLFALSKAGAVEAGALAMARATVARLGDPALARDLAADPTGAIGMTLDAIGAVATAVVARPAPGRPVAA